MCTVAEDTYTNDRLQAQGQLLHACSVQIDPIWHERGTDPTSHTFMAIMTPTVHKLHVFLHSSKLLQLLIDAADGWREPALEGNAVLGEVNTIHACSTWYRLRVGGKGQSLGAGGRGG